MALADRRTAGPPRGKGRTPSSPRGPGLAGSPHPRQTSCSMWICGLKCVFCVPSACSVLNEHLCHDPMNETKEQKARHQRIECMTTLPNLRISPKTGNMSKGFNAMACCSPEGVCTEEPLAWGAGKRTGSARSKTAPTCPGDNAQPIRALVGILDHSRTKV